MADDNLSSFRVESIVASRARKVMSRKVAISFTDLQTASSRLILFLRPAIMTERFSI